MQMPRPNPDVLRRKAELVRRLHALLPSDSVISDPVETKAYECDGLSAYRCPPMAAVLPRSTQEVATVLKLCHEMNVPVVPRGAGTGFVWDDKGHIVSNFHVVYKASAVTVTFGDGTAYDAEIVGVDPDHDIAVLKIGAPAAQLVPVQVGTSADLRVGQKVLAIGNPFGLDTSLSVGVVSALGRTITAMTERRIYDVVQTDAAINPGNSGGPLLDSSGRLIGMNTAIISPSGSSAGLGFAVPVDTVRRIVPQLLSHGEVRRVGLGVQLVPDSYARRWGLEGVAVYSVVPGSAASTAGLTGLRQTRGGRVVIGDVVVEVDGARVANHDDLIAILDRHEAGDAVSVTVMRGDARRRIEIALQHLD